LFQSHEWETLLTRGLAPDLHPKITNKNIGFPGWPERNLDCVLVLGGQLTKGGLHRPPFLFSDWMHPETLPIRFFSMDST